MRWYYVVRKKKKENLSLDFTIGYNNKDNSADIQRKAFILPLENNSCLLTY